MPRNKASVTDDSAGRSTPENGICDQYFGVFRIHRSCKPANPAFTMSNIQTRVFAWVTRGLCLKLVVRRFGLSRGLNWDGGADRDRTDDLKLAKLPLSQLSYGPRSWKIRWWARDELNVRPHAYQACALTT